ncbi:glutamate dehydrogenase, partial [Mammaliicoccus sciuri]|nr:glutamate dehydrogenase [Mammaliicoccus sciuri]
TKIVEAFDKVYDISQKRKLDMRLSAYVVGVRRTAEATRFRGWA